MSTKRGGGEGTPQAGNDLSNLSPKSSNVRKKAVTKSIVS